ncbi:hypothetical protein SDC9_34486 [bioreactor metagenome]|jgi:hypothetical protein|uniref:Prepilin-type N-terminal cleavage/methylation domain-containing protein n=1 Tax=bioreactor metagenome TaxID=1076179 RepID=A0A644VCK1_9ZZZZ
MNSKKGFMLLEITIAFMLMCLLFATFYQGFLQMAVSMRKIYDDVELNRVAGAVMSTVESEIMYSSQQVILQDNKYGNRIVCRNIGPNRTVAFYCSKVEGTKTKVVVYKSTQIAGRPEGVNPLSSQSVSAEKFQVEKIDGRTLRLEIELKIETTGRSKTFIEVIRLCNGHVI